MIVSQSFRRKVCPPYERGSDVLLQIKLRPRVSALLHVISFRQPWLNFKIPNFKRHLDRIVVTQGAKDSADEDRNLLSDIEPA